MASASDFYSIDHLKVAGSSPALGVLTFARMDKGRALSVLGSARYFLSSANDSKNSCYKMPLTSALTLEAQVLSLFTPRLRFSSPRCFSWNSGREEIGVEAEEKIFHIH